MHRGLAGVEDLRWSGASKPEKHYPQTGESPPVESHKFITGASLQ